MKQVRAKKVAQKPGKKPAAKPIGRPSTYSVAMADKICARVASGEALYRICQEATMPCLTAVYQWLRKHDAFAQNYARAKDDMADTYASRIAAIIDEPMEREPITGKVDLAWVHNQRLKVDTLKWQAGKMKPKVYGEKSEMTLKGDAENPVAVTTKVVIVPQKQAVTVETKPLKAGD